MNADHRIKWSYGANQIVPNGLFPTWWKAPPPELTYDEQIVIDWLERQVDGYKIEMMPILFDISGWRNREVYDYLQSYDWTERMFV